MFKYLKKALSSIYDQFTSKIQALFSQNSIDSQALAELETILINADTGVSTTRAIITQLKQDLASGKIATGIDLKNALATQLLNHLSTKTCNAEADVYLLVGINGSGKTTCAAKLGLWLKQQNKKVLFIAGDTFRAAATEQLSAWAQKLSIDIVTGNNNQDPASVVFAGCQNFKDKNYNALIIDTAGRLQTKINLMKELEKIKRVIEKQLPHKRIITLLTVDSMLGQNSFEQAKIFNESTQLDGVILTKLDGTGKGGIIFSITQELKIPIAFISYGEKPEQLALFNPQQYVTELLEK